MYDIIEQNYLQDKILKERLYDILPRVMEETHTDCWLIICREYNEDPVFHHIVPALYPTARRTTVFVFTNRDGVTDRISVSRPSAELEPYYRRDYDLNKETQMEALTRVLQEFNPEHIAVNISDGYAYTDGMSVGLYNMLKRELPEELTDKFTSSDDVGIRFLETRTPTEEALYPEVMAEALDIIENAFSDAVIHPGTTTCRDVINFMIREVNHRGLIPWFVPEVNLQNENGMLENDAVINRGDLVHCDFGIVYMNMRTDTQRLCYICREGENDLPDELKKAMKRNNRFQDIVRRNMKIGRSGNEVFTDSVEQGKAEGLRPVLYSHPLGLFGHSAGPTIGLWDHQKGDIHPSGDLLIHDHTTYALELSIIEYLEMYHRDTYIFTEESVRLIDNQVEFLGKNRERIKVIGKPL